MKQRLVDVVICARNSAGTLAQALAELPMRQIRSVVVVDNGSTDGTAQAAQDGGAIVVRESKIGYGAACKRAIAHLDSLPTSPDVVVFFPADGSCDPTEIPAIIEPLSSDNAELVLGVAGQPRRMKAPTRVALKMVGVLYRYRFEDFGAFRAIRFPALIALGMTDPGDGWNIEMQLKSVKLGLTIVEVPVSHREAPHSRRDRFRRARKSVGTAGRMLFQILRHSTAR